MSDEQRNKPIGKKRNRKKISFKYFYLFAFVFFAALGVLSYTIKNYSPDVDVTIGNSDSFTLSEADMDIEINSVDERLKWIQMEDEMPTVALRENKKKSETNILNDVFDAEKNEDEHSKKQEEKKVKNPPSPTIKEIQSQKLDFRLAAAPTHSQIVPKPKPMYTKVYLGGYSNIEDAITMQNKVSKEFTLLTPFIKAVKDFYVVQLGSFSEEQKAQDLVITLKQAGYNPKTVYEN